MTMGQYGSDAFGVGIRQDISGAMTSVILRYVRNRGGEPAVAEMLRLAGETRPAAVLEDPTSWSSHDEAIALFDAGARVTGDPDIGRHVGEEMLRQHDGTEVANLLRSLGSPGELLRNVAAAAAKFTTVSTMEPLEVGDAHAVVRAVTRPGFSRHIQMCEFTKGLLSQVPVLFGLVPGVVAESECQARGGRFCLYSVAWEARQWSAFVDERTSLYTMAWDEQGVVEAQSEIELDEETRSAQLEKQVQQLQDRLDAVYSTAADLLGTDDIDGLLKRITERAAHAVNAPRYLLVVQLAPDAPYRTQHHGFTPAEAQALAEELLQDNPDTRAGARLISDIASKRRHYGRLAAVYPVGGQFLESEKRALEVYSNYAATALDVVSSLEEARTSNRTANGLLEFSRTLAQATRVKEVVQRLADTVPLVIGCDRATVMLWDPESQTIRVHARTGGSELETTGNGTGNTTGAGEEGGSAASTGGPQHGGQAGISGGASRADADAGTGAMPMSTPGAPGLPDGVTLGDDGELVISRSASPLVDRLLATRDIMVLDQRSEDPVAVELLSATATATAVLAPLVASDEVLGFVSANFDTRSDSALAGDRDLKNRITGLADQAVTALQNARLLEEIRHLAVHDALTGLPNRRLLEDRAGQELIRSKRTGESVCMFFVDLDRFKHVNDTLGHAAGDELIQEVARRLCETVRRQDTVARLGGDEFAVLLPGLGDPVAIDQLARRALESLNRPYLIAGQEVHTSASIGVAVAPLHGETYDELLSNADAAMYRSKGLGRNTFQMFDADEAEAPVGTLQIETELHHAIERGEMFVLYQPFIDLQTASVVGVEALARWRHPTKGVLEPDSFIPIAEESNLIVGIDSWVVGQACHQIRGWAEAGLPTLRIAVNVSSRDLASDDFVMAVEHALTDTGIDPSLLELEITERVVMDEIGVMGRNVERLQALGVRFSIDDFGTGNSALSRIGTFPVSTLKIDQSFVQVLGPEEESSALITAIINLAQSLGVDCVAEGVETSHQSRVLLQRGCTTAQGFFFSPPLLPNDVERMLRTSPRGGAGGSATAAGDAAGDGSAAGGASSSATPLPDGQIGPVGSRGAPDPASPVQATGVPSAPSIPQPPPEWR